MEVSEIDKTNAAQTIIHELNGNSQILSVSLE